MTKQAKFKIKVGETEIELEGAEEKVLALYEKAFSWASSQRTISKVISEEPKEIKFEGAEEEEERRGGPRKATISPIVEKIVSDGFIQHPNRRTLEEIMEEMGRRGYPSTGKKVKDSVYGRLRRMRQSGDVKAVKEGDIWTYWTEV